MSGEPTSAPAGPPRRASRLAGHRGRVTALAVSADGRLALSAGRDGFISLWDVRTGFEVRSFPAFAARVRAVAFSPDGRLLAATGADRSGAREMAAGGLRVWDAESGQELRRAEFDGVPTSLAFLPDGGRVVIGDIGCLRVWELDGPSQVAMIPAGRHTARATEQVGAVAVSPDGRVALAGLSAANAVALFDLGSGKELRRCEGHGPVAAFPPDGRRILSGGRDQTARVWDLLTGREQARFLGHKGWWGWRGVVGVAWLGDERAVSASEDGRLCVWDADSGERLVRDHHGAGVTCLAATGGLVLTGGRDGVIRVWELG